MLDELVLKNVKAATVGLGLVKKGSAEPFIIFGSGFLVDPNGYVMTALQVLGADVMEGNESTHYTAKVGLAYGLTTNILNVILNNVADFFERNIKDIPYPFDTTTIHPPNFRRL